MEVLCFSHLRWDFVYQRPQHLLTRFAARGRVHFWEEHQFGDVARPELHQTVRNAGVRVLTPWLPRTWNRDQVVTAIRALLDEYVLRENVQDFVAWYYTPMALEFSDHLTPVANVYDCMDELSAFLGAPPQLLQLERHLFNKADIVFAGGSSLYEAKRPQHANVHLFPSSIDHEHFKVARLPQTDPADQIDIPHPRIGFYGVLDERLDRDLIREVAARHPDWHLILVGPIVKIREEDLPFAPNLHYLGHKSYSELPAYLGNWDVAMLPFARNPSTRFISPTKTPEYLAGGRPVVSTPIHDVVEPYGRMALVRIASTAAAFSEAIEKSLGPQDEAWCARVDRFLAKNSWDKTFEAMFLEIQRVVSQTPATIQLNEKGGTACLTI